MRRLPHVRHAILVRVRIEDKVRRCAGEAARAGLVRCVDCIVGRGLSVGDGEKLHPIRHTTVPPEISSRCTASDTLSAARRCWSRDTEGQRRACDDRLTQRRKDNDSASVNRQSGGGTGSSIPGDPPGAELARQSVPSFELGVAESSGVAEKPAPAAAIGQGASSINVTSKTVTPDAVARRRISPSLLSFPE